MLSTRNNLFFALAVLLLQAGVSLAADYPYIPLEQDPTWTYSVRLWIMGPDPLWSGNPPTFHELSDAEFAMMGEERTQTVKPIQYDKGTETYWGVLHEELRFVLWMNRTPGSLGQVGETPKDTWDLSLTPAENDAAGHIDWFTAYPRSWLKYPNYDGQIWTEAWGPFDPVDGYSYLGDPTLRQRDCTISYLTYDMTLNGLPRTFDAVRITSVGPSEADPLNQIVTEAYTFVDGIGMVERYFDSQTGGVMTFKHIAVMDTMIPEPASLVILLAGFALVAGVRKHGR